ncbi:hypothetical protein QMK33_19705 [Hymenobacter sp. H14-R3]|uniref:hypothetical protein n=1 Tax=Hymenobacter sp. H14-R3 TaxID=3046308 RepID=UPI0024B8B7B9|nr:hypothetical protein [Hymenobacter sp. H14-R3]MDJ0367380.1 hypothetical protein [Hymenobacter sp. H14-R3]
MEEQIIETKQLRVDLDAIIQRVKALPANRPISLVRTKLDEAVMWLGQNLKELGTPYPYPNSRDTSNTTIDPTADGLKF